MAWKSVTGLTLMEFFESSINSIQLRHTTFEAPSDDSENAVGAVVKGLKKY